MRRLPLTQIWIHLISWVIIFSVPVWSMSNRGLPMDPNFWIHSILLPLGYLIVFYLNYYGLIKHLLFNHKTTSFLLVNTCMIAILVVWTTLMKDLFPPSPIRHLPPPPRDMPGPRGGVPFFFQTLMLYSVMGIAVALRMTTKWYADAARIQELEKHKTETELQQLKSQLNPHFLFNSLNTIYALVQFNQDRAQSAIHSLSDLLRYQLYEANHTRISIAKELAFVRSYCALMQLRVPKHCRIDMVLDAGETETSVAPLLFISLVENAFKHGIHPTEPCHVDIQIRVSEDASIFCCVSNSLHPSAALKSSGESLPEEGGIGLENLQRRLHLLYPHQHLFTIEKSDNMFIAKIILFPSPSADANSMLYHR